MANENYEKQFYSSILSSIDKNDSHNFYNEMNNAIKSGKLEIFQKRSYEQLTFDSTWINQIKDYLRYVENIVRNPRIYMQAVEEVTPIQRAKKINARSIQHLSSHVQNVQELRADGTIVPSKVLSTTFEDTFAIYENRFVMTLISKLAAFVEVRYNSILEGIKSYQSDKMVAKSTFKWRNYDIEATIDLKVKEEIIDEVSKKNQELLDDIITIRNYAKGFMNSSFYQTMREKTRPVTPPILRTNIISKSVDYNSCLRLWLFLDSYRQLGIDLNVMDKDLTFDQPFIDDVCDMIMLNYSLIAVNQADRKEGYDLLPYRMKKEKAPKENKLLIATDEQEMVNKEDPNEPSISEYFYQRTKKQYKTQYTEMVKSGISYNKSFVNIYRKMLKVENGIQDEIVESMEEHLPNTSSITEKRKAKYKFFKQKKRVYQSLIYAKQQDLYKQQAKLEKVNKELENFEKEEKAYQAELRLQRRRQLRDYRLKQKLEAGEMTQEEIDAFIAKDEKAMKRIPKAKKPEVAKEEIIQDKPVENEVENTSQVEENEPQLPKQEEELTSENITSSIDEISKEVEKNEVVDVEKAPEEENNLPPEEEVRKEEVDLPFADHFDEEEEKVKSQRDILMERLAKARQTKHSKEVKVASKKKAAPQPVKVEEGNSNSLNNLTVSELKDIIPNSEIKEAQTKVISEEVASEENGQGETKVTVDNRTARLMEYLQRARLAKHSKEVKVDTSKKENKE